MKYLEFRYKLIAFKIFSTRDVLKVFPGFDSKRLIEWQKKNYILKLINKWYLFTEIPVDELLLYRISNCIYRPSYITLESALSYYNLIPEGVYSPQAITTHKTITYTTPAGNFTYRNIKPALFFGYSVIHKDELPVLIAEPEKAILDYLYFNAHLKKLKDIEALRFNYEILKNVVDWNKLEKYSQLFENKMLNQRIKGLKKILSHANIT